MKGGMKGLPPESVVHSEPKRYFMSFSKVVSEALYRAPSFMGSIAFPSWTRSEDIGSSASNSDSFLTGWKKPKRKTEFHDDPLLERGRARKTCLLKKELSESFMTSSGLRT